jgi:DNA-binding transcriptional MerR regulator
MTAVASKQSANGGGDVAEQLTIDQLAQLTGMTVRNIRAHQSRGLLPPPEVRARTGYYGPDHVARIKLIQEMQAEGYNLKAIERLVQGATGAAEEALGFKRALLAPFGDEQPEYVTQDELDRRFKGPFEPKVLRKVEKLGLLRPLGDGRFEVPSPTLLRAGEELVELGVEMTHVLAVAEQVLRHSRSVAQAFVRLFVDDVLDGLPPSGSDASAEWARLRDALEKLRPLASDALMAAFQQTMTEETERRFTRVLDK